MGTAFPGLVGCFIGLLGVEDDLGMVVGWADGYIVYATPDTRLERIAWDRGDLRITGRGAFTDGNAGADDADELDDSTLGKAPRAAA